MRFSRKERKGRKGRETQMEIMMKTFGCAVISCCLEGCILIPCGWECESKKVVADWSEKKAST